MNGVFWYLICVCELLTFALSNKRVIWCEDFDKMIRGCMFYLIAVFLIFGDKRLSLSLGTN